MFLRGLASLALKLCVLAVAGGAFAQDYPTKPVRVIVPFPPGGGTDLMARMVVQKLGEVMGGTYVIENRGGAGGTVGSEVAAKSAPDGYTLLVVSGAHAINPSLYPKLPYDTLRDFAPVTMMTAGPGLLVVHPSLPAKSVKEFIAIARSRPGQLDFASAGIGTPPHLAGELFKTMTGINMVHIPYKGNGPAYVDLLAGHVPVMFPTIPTAIPYVRAGRIRALAVTSAKRTEIVPELPTISEAGVRGYEVTSWYGLLAPAGTPAAIVSRVQQGIAKVLRSPDVSQRLKADGLDLVGNTPAEFAATIRSEIAKWAKVVKASGAKVD